VTRHFGPQILDGSANAHNLDYVLCPVCCRTIRSWELFCKDCGYVFPADIISAKIRLYYERSWLNEIVDVEEGKTHESHGD